MTTIELPERRIPLTLTEKAVGHPLSILEATAICDQLAQAEHIHVAVRFEPGDPRVHLYPVEPVTTREEVHALRAFAAVSDQTLAWHEYIGGVA